jgi:hypothetical protein
VDVLGLAGITEDNMTIKSVSYDQTEIIGSIMSLCGIERFDVDLTYGNGKFYTAENMPVHRFDIDETLPNLTDSCSSASTPLGDNSVSSVQLWIVCRPMGIRSP